MLKSARNPERTYSIVLWVLSIVFAAFIIGLGNLVIGDLPLVDKHISSETPDRSAQEKANDQAIRQAELTRQSLDDRLEIERLKEEQARRASQTGQETFSAWIAARTATTNSAQDPEVLARTRELEQLKANERSLQATIADLENERVENEQRISALHDENYRIAADRQPALERAYFLEELRIFALRLLITLPMLGAAAWMVAKKCRSDHWPLMRGFVLAAAFVFFVELVPYLPSYGGYIRYGVGIALTLVAGHFLVRNMRAYLARRKAVEQQAEQERRKLVSHDEAFKKMAAKICPGCDRPIANMEGAETNFCVHCGMTLFDHCTSCDARKMAFFRYCMACGAPSADTETPAPPSVPPGRQAPPDGVPVPG